MKQQRPAVSTQNQALIEGLQTPTVASWVYMELEYLSFYHLSRHILSRDLSSPTNAISITWRDLEAIILVRLQVIHIHLFACIDIECSRETSSSLLCFTFVLPSATDLEINPLHSRSSSLSKVAERYSPLCSHERLVAANETQY